MNIYYNSDHIHSKYSTPFSLDLERRMMKNGK